MEGGLIDLVTIDCVREAQSEVTMALLKKAANFQQGEGQRSLRHGADMTAVAGGKSAEFDGGGGGG